MMKPIIFFTMLIALMVISGKNLQVDTEISTIKIDSFGITIPAEEKVANKQQAKVERDTAITKCKTDAADLAPVKSLDLVLPGKHIANLCIIL